MWYDQLMRRTKLKPSEAARIRAEWLGAIDSLEHQVHEWAEQQGWAVSRSERELDEQSLGTYKVPILEIETPRGEVVLEPVGQDTLGGWGRVDLSAWPSLYRVRLLWKSGQNWVVRTDSGLDWPHPWGPATFVELAEGLVAAE
jgi:hypothetical protein